MRKRIGLSMRVERFPGRPDEHDCLAHDWAGILREALGNVSWFPVPNLGPHTEAYLAQVGLEALILTGGNTIGASPIRDDSERRMLEYCVRNNLPVLGVCRGLQMVHCCFGGLAPGPVSESTHAGRPHAVEAVTMLGQRLLAQRAEVNSYHRWGLLADEVASEFEVWAVSRDAVAEGLIHRTRRIIASQWHPERAPDCLDAGVSLIRYFYHEL